MQRMSWAAKTWKIAQKWKIVAKYSGCLNISLRQKKGNHYEGMRLLKSRNWISSRAQSTDWRDEVPISPPDSGAGCAAEELWGAAPDNTVTAAQHPGS